MKLILVLLRSLWLWAEVFFELPLHKMWVLSHKSLKRMRKRSLKNTNCMQVLRKQVLCNYCIFKQNIVQNIRKSYRKTSCKLFKRVCYTPFSPRAKILPEVKSLQFRWNSTFNWGGEIRFNFKTEINFHSALTFTCNHQDSVQNEAYIGLYL